MGKFLIYTSKNMAYGFEDFKRDVQEYPLAYPLLKAYGSFLNIRRYEKFPFYIYPQGVSLSSFEEKIIRFCDFLIDAHELERNKTDFGMSFISGPTMLVRTS